ncbi:homeobox domain-containing protein [Hamiltosporidium tvaerminnensis]|uniref:Homeobox domain-containing protein n=2 Tax=Hamiltosporidium TaxID=1176354 RepID=A0A4Q9L877_9MICR|nr:LIM/homeobox protein Lhx4 [Hamiltosporidium tvaerminnensis]TBU01327.1 homeobox domain-containing protein [Hamiltosporidium magnivora]TBU03909.1 homeobox domain-containing protein [Hamiltosporidium magnivora]TBU04773.1 homeobox domain-containing protein [Hamiltosporidium tvaerminnensis]TBU05597.1 homeobox domain-containing protein [Hamiltosporidium magnivora]
MRATPPKNVKFIDSTREILNSYNKSKCSKRTRTKLSLEQLNALEESFQSSAHPTNEIKEVLSKEIKIPVKNVQIWFQNRRAKDKAVKETVTHRSDRRGHFEHEYIEYPPHQYIPYGGYSSRGRDNGYYHINDYGYYDQSYDGYYGDSGKYGDKQRNE